MRKFLEKIQNKPEKFKKTILWTIIIIIGVIFFSVWINLVGIRVASQENAKIFPDLQNIKDISAEQKENNPYEEIELIQEFTQKIRNINFTEEELQTLENLTKDIKNKDEISSEELIILEKITKEIDSMEFTPEEFKKIEDFFGSMLNLELDEESLKAWEKLMENMDI